jgi:hypothetical protein
MLADYATATGGDIVYARKSSTLENLYSKITEQARHAYTIAYVPTGNLKESDFHAVRVTPTSGLTVSTRRGYYSRTDRFRGGRQQLGELGAEVTRRNLNVQPTIKIRVGYRFNSDSVPIETTRGVAVNSVFRLPPQ